MGEASHRTRLTRDLNRSFGAENIEATAQRVRTTSPRGDFLDISEALGLLTEHHGGNFARYRRGLTLPKLVQKVLTAAYREALFNKPKPIPLRIRINRSPDNSIEVKHTDRQITVVLNRPDAPVRRTR